MPRVRAVTLLLPLLVVLAVLGCATGATSGTGPELPQWFIVVLGLILPFAMNTFICRLPSWAKPAVSYGLSGIIACLAGFLFAGWRTLPDFLGNLVWLWATSQFVYDILVRGVTQLNKAHRRRQMLGPSVHRKR